MTTGNEGNGDRPSRKAIVLQKISARGLTWKKVCQAAENTTDKLTRMKIATTAVLYFYLSLFGVIFDLTFYQHRYGLDPFKYANLEDFIFSAVKHWDVTLVVLLFVLLALIILMLLWNAFVTVTWTVCYLTPGRLEKPPKPARPRYRRPRSVYSGTEGARVWREFRSSVRATISDRTTRGWSNLHAFVKFALQNARYRCVRAVSVVRERLFSADKTMPSDPARPTYRGPSWTSLVEAGNKPWWQLWSDFHATVWETTTRTCSNLWLSFGWWLASIVYFLNWATTQFCNGLIDLYWRIARLPEKLLKPVKGILIVVAALVCFAVAPTVGADLILYATPVKSVGEEGTLCTRRPYDCELVSHIGSTSSYAFFRTDKLEQDTKQTVWEWWGFLKFFDGLVFWRSFEFWESFKFWESFEFWGSLKEFFGLEDDPSSENDPGSEDDPASKPSPPPVQVVPLSNIASFSLQRKPTPPAGGVTLVELKESLDRAKKEILGRINKIGDKQPPSPISLEELKKALKDNSSEILGRIEQIVDPPTNPAKAISLTTLNLAMKTNSTAILKGIAGIKGDSEGKKPHISLTELKTALDDNSHEILGRIKKMVGETPDPAKTVNLPQLKAAIEVNNSLIRDGITTISGVPGDSGGNQSTKPISLAKLQTTLDKKARLILERIGTVDKNVDQTEDTVVDRTKKIVTAVDGGKQEILNRINQFEQRRPPNWYNLVTHYVVINRSQTDGVDPKVKTRRIYSLAGFKPGKSNLTPYHRDWLTDFGNAMKQCVVNRPTIRIIGFSSAETFKGSVKKLPNLCKSQGPETDQKKSAINNCFLANNRAGEVASAIFEAMKTVRSPTKEELLNSMNGHCAESTSDFQPANFTFMNIKPWCQVSDMQNARLNIDSADVEKQPNFLNKGVHIVILDRNNCPGF